MLDLFNPVQPAVKDDAEDTAMLFRFEQLPVRQPQRVFSVEPYSSPSYMYETVLAQVELGNMLPCTVLASGVNMTRLLQLVSVESLCVTMFTSSMYSEADVRSSRSSQLVRVPLHPPCLTKPGELYNTRHAPTFVQHPVINLITFPELAPVPHCVPCVIPGLTQLSSKSAL